MKRNMIMTGICSLLAWNAYAEDVKKMEKQTEMMDRQESSYQKAVRLKNEVSQLQGDIKRFLSAYEEKKISLDQLRNFYEKRVKSFCLYYHELSREELSVILDAPPESFMRSHFCWDIRFKLNDLTELFMNEDRGEPVPFTGHNYSYTGPKEVVALKVFSDGMDDFLKWIKIFDRLMKQ